jgi:hypothetical protein
MEPLIAIVVVWGLCGVTCAIIADSRGRSVPGWLVLGFLLGVFGLILVIVLPPIKAPVEPGYAVVDPIGADHGRIVSVHGTLARAKHACGDGQEVIMALRHLEPGDEIRLRD